MGEARGRGWKLSEVSGVGKGFERRKDMGVRVLAVRGNF